MAGSAGAVSASGPLRSSALDEIVAHDDGRGWAATDQARETIMASEDRREGIAAFFERRRPEWPGR